MATCTIFCLFPHQVIFFSWLLPFQITFIPTYWLSLQSFIVESLSFDLFYFSFIIFQAFQCSNWKTHLLLSYMNDVKFLFVFSHQLNYFVDNVSWRPKGLSQEQMKDLKPFWRVSVLSSLVRNVTVMLNFHMHTDHFCLLICQFTSTQLNFPLPNAFLLFKQNFLCWAL